MRRGLLGFVFDLGLLLLIVMFGPPFVLTMWVLGWLSDSIDRIERKRP